MTTTTEALRLAREALARALSDDQPYITACTEAIAAIDSATSGEPAACEWTNCPTRVGNVCCHDRAAPQAAPAPQAEPTDPLHDDAYLRAIALGFPAGDSRRWTLCRIADRLETAQASAAAAPEPVATLWQHCETGRTRVTMPDQVFTQDATWIVVGPLYLHPSQEAANSQAILDGSAEPVATLHDDGCFTWKRDEFRLKYDRQRAGWRMDVYAHPAPAVAATVRGLTDAEIDELWKAPMSADWEHREFARAIERAHGITIADTPAPKEQQ